MERNQPPADKAFPDRFRDFFKQSANLITQMYKEGQAAYNAGLCHGRQEAYEDILNWFIYSHNPDFRYISAQDFFAFVQSRFNELQQTDALASDPPNNDFSEAQIVASEPLHSS